MKYAARIFLVFLILFLISEISYQVTAGVLAEQETDGEVPKTYLEGLEYDRTRLEAEAKFVFEAEDTDLDVSQWMGISPAEAAGMDEGEFQEYLDQYMLPEEMVSIGLTDLKIQSFERHKAVISVSYETSETKRYHYWCIAEEGVIRVYDSKRKQLVLEQLFVRTRFTPSERRMLSDGIYVRDYDELIRLIGTLQETRTLYEDKRL